ncbi:taste receptor type 2 member 9-like [Tupaia chinensis]|uniref:taste receptor type 2 member 9-like n=1 Tax=Tupaia chinensis TaxID=246437 RepID=UPI0003C8E5E0|nr:taste receptor type 2 member 9-like [Tupaia chinensis]
MSRATETIYIILIVGQLTIGIWGNVFIVLINCIGLFKRKDITLIDIILIILAISRICVLCVVTFDGFILVFSPEKYESDTLVNMVDVVWTFSSNTSVWFTSCLSIFYLLKIANLSHPFFLWLKLKINRVILGILLVSVFISLIISVSMNDDMWYHLFKASHENITSSSNFSKMSKTPNTMKQISMNLGASVPFILCLISLFLLLFSLFRHTKQMKLHATGSRDPSTEAHMRAIKAVAIFLLLFVVYYVVLFILTLNFLFSQKNLVIMIGGIIAVIFPSSHSFVLIMGNDKLRKAFLRVLRFLKGFHKGRKPSDLETPREYFA